MLFQNISGLIGLISIPIIVAFYLFKQRYTEQTVPSIMLWKRAVELSEAQRPWQKLRKNLLMVIQILTALALVFVLSMPYIQGMTESEDYVLILDCSMSMQAEDTGISRFERAKDEMTAFIKDLPANDNVTVIALTAAPYVVVSGGADDGNIAEKIKSTAVTYGGADFERVTGIIDSIVEDANIIVFSDKEYESDLRDLRYVLFGIESENLAISRFSSSLSDDGIAVLIKVRNYGRLEKQNSVSLFIDDMIFDTVSFVVDAGKEREMFFSIPGPDKPMTFMAKLAEGDYLSADDTAYLAYNPETPKKTVLFTKQNIFLENMLSLLKNIELYKGTEASMEALSGYQLHIFDGILPSALPEDGHIMVFNPPVDNDMFKSHGKISYPETDKNTAGFFSFLNNINFDIYESLSFDIPDWAEPMLESGENVLAYTGTYGKQKVAVFGFDLHKTDLPLRVEFPIMLFEVSKWFLPDGLSRNVDFLCGGSYEIELPADCVSATVYTPLNEIADIAPPFPARPFDRTEIPGVYMLEEVNSTETSQYYIAVNCFSAEESDITPNETDVFESSEFIKQIAGQNDIIKTLAAILLVALLLAEWWVFNNERI